MRRPSLSNVPGRSAAPPALAALLALGLAVAGCGGDDGDGDGSASTAGAGGSGRATGGARVGTGGYWSSSGGTTPTGGRPSGGTPGAGGGSAASSGREPVEEGGSAGSSESDPGDEGGSAGTSGSDPGDGGGGNTTGGSTTLTSCEPLDMGDWDPPAYVPARHDAACTSAEIAAYYDACLFGTDCSDYEPGGSSADCGACLEPSSPTDDTWGPVLLTRPPPFYVYDSNAGGCIDLVGEAECGAKIQAADACARAACDEPCSVDGSLAFEAYQDCTRTARQTVCSEYQAAAVCIMDAGHADACSGSGSFESLFVALAEVFCGQG